MLISFIFSSNTEFAISVYQKKTQYGPGYAQLKNNLFKNVTSKYIIEEGSSLIENSIKLKQYIDKSTQDVLNKLKRD